MEVQEQGLVLLFASFSYLNGTDMQGHDYSKLCCTVIHAQFPRSIIPFALPRDVKESPQKWSLQQSHYCKGKQSGTGLGWSGYQIGSVWVPDRVGLGTRSGRSGYQIRSVLGIRVKDTKYP